MDIIITKPETNDQYQEMIIAPQSRESSEVLEQLQSLQIQESSTDQKNSEPQRKYQYKFLQKGGILNESYLSFVFNSE